MYEIEDLPSSFYMGVQVKYCLLEVRNVPRFMDRNQLYELLESFGPIEYLDKHPHDPRTYYLTFQPQRRPLDFELYITAANLKDTMGIDWEIQIVPAKGHANTIFVCNLGDEDPNDVLEIFLEYGQITEVELIENPQLMLKIQYEDALQALTALYNEHYAAILEGSKVPMKVFYMEYEDYSEPNLIVANLPEKCNAIHVYKLLRRFGIIVNIVRVYDQAFVTFLKKEATIFASALKKPFVIGGRKLILFTI